MSNRIVAAAAGAAIATYAAVAASLLAFPSIAASKPVASFAATEARLDSSDAVTGQVQTQVAASTVNREERGWDDTSDRVPVWIKFAGAAPAELGRR
ncbi:hypothetical protein JOD31_001716 [Methylopila capsulata]|uniref:Uncharacterized protein n=1 Tax=Methylopila capsulata TaxID=61654 RepID=A0A9W6MQD1_9HYPH|nr:hypothetical protein [Methylopila capsulata]MBM7851491.1 hypothetical protein [Methylopila capsulata]GLK54550.1 hypothetical protein GCM10008170_05690 [Methylopila capsulata]